MLNTKAAVILVEVDASEYIAYSGNLGLISTERATCDAMAWSHQRRMSVSLAERISDYGLSFSLSRSGISRVRQKRPNTEV